MLYFVSAAVDGRGRRGRPRCRLDWSGQQASEVRSSISVRGGLEAITRAQHADEMRPCTLHLSITTAATESITWVGTDRKTEAETCHANGSFNHICLGPHPDRRVPLRTLRGAWCNVKRPETWWRKACRVRCTKQGWRNDNPSRKGKGGKERRREGDKVVGMLG